mmetsp:Transcript_19738/g.54894  ORF Transcript_19738/g.54894 Transcript_19738/m.54894 type:complete len:253 (+) Transcript_19738:357-1115(+)
MLQRPAFKRRAVMVNQTSVHASIFKVRVLRPLGVLQCPSLKTDPVVAESGSAKLALSMVIRQLTSSLSVTCGSECAEHVEESSCLCIAIVSKQDDGVITCAFENPSYQRAATRLEQHQAHPSSFAPRFPLLAGIGREGHLPLRHSSCRRRTLPDGVVGAVSKQFVRIPRVVHLARAFIGELGLDESEVCRHGQEAIRPGLMLRTQSLTAQIIRQTLQTAHEVMPIEERRHVLYVVDLWEIDPQQFEELLLRG